MFNSTCRSDHTADENKVGNEEKNNNKIFTQTTQMLSATCCRWHVHSPRWSFSSERADPFRVTPIVRDTDVHQRGNIAMSTGQTH